MRAGLGAVSTAAIGTKGAVVGDGVAVADSSSEKTEEELNCCNYSLLEYMFSRFFSILTIY